MATSASGGRTEENKPSILSTLPKHLPLDFLKSITDQFSEKCIIGEGAFGTVYKVYCCALTVSVFSEVAERVWG